MKRILPVVLALAILFPALLLPAAAAEIREYTFYRVELPSFYTSFPFVPGFPEPDVSSSYAFIYEGFLEEGDYFLSFSPDSFVDNPIFGNSVFEYSDSISVIYSDSVSGYLTFSSSVNLHVLINSIPQVMSINVFGYVFGEDNEFFTYVFLGSNEFTDNLALSLDELTFVVHDLNFQLNSFFDTINDGFKELTSFNLTQIFIFSFGLISAPVLFWFGFRYVKAKVKKSFMKGKI